MNYHMIYFLLFLLFAGCSELNLNSDIITDFQEINENPEYYLDKSLSVKGKMGVDIIEYIGAVNYLYDNNGLRVYIKNKYKRTWTKGDVFTLSGIFKYDSASKLYYLEEITSTEFEELVENEKQQQELLKKINTNPEIDLNHIDKCTSEAQKETNLDVTQYKWNKCIMVNGKLEFEYEIKE